MNKKMNEDQLNIFLDTEILSSSTEISLWTIREMLQYWQRGKELYDGLTIHDAAFDLQQIAKVCGL